MSAIDDLWCVCVLSVCTCMCAGVRGLALGGGEEMRAIVDLWMEADKAAQVRVLAEEEEEEEAPRYFSMQSPPHTQVPSNRKAHAACAEKQDKYARRKRRACDESQHEYVSSLRTRRRRRHCQMRVHVRFKNV
jgi:hypothetical protein